MEEQYVMHLGEWRNDETFFLIHCLMGRRRYADDVAKGEYRTLLKLSGAPFLRN